VAQRHYSFIYPVLNELGGCLWYLLQHGQVHAAFDEPQDLQTAEQCLAVLERVYTSGTPPVTQTMREDAEVTLLVAAWFHSRPNELGRTLSPEVAKERLRAMCGGIGLPGLPQAKARKGLPRINLL
jgi:hypothetical protein